MTNAADFSKNSHAGRGGARGNGRPGGGSQGGRAGRGGSNPRHGGGRQHDDRPKSGSKQDLIQLLRSVDGSSYGAYKRALGDWDYGEFQVHLDRIQSDPYAPPSAIRLVTTPQALGLPESATGPRDAQIAAADYLQRRCAAALRGGDISIAGLGQEILERSALSVTPERVEVRLQVRMPARGRTIQGRQAAQIFERDVPALFDGALDLRGKDDAQRDLTRHIQTMEDHRALQAALEENRWVAFVADGAVLPRESGISERPLTDAVPFESPDSRAATVQLPHAGQVTGMAVGRGVTLIVGGGYHGKSTLLSAIERGVYPHVPGDGRELVAALPAAMKVRAADGRPITDVDVSPFINHLPTGSDTAHFSTQNASGSTSQAASIVECLEGLSPLLLIDEDTSATNLMIRDERMRALVSASEEPITPLIDRIQGLTADGEVSAVIVMGGSGAYLDVADCVLQMNSYHCTEATERARKVSAEYPRQLDALPGFPALPERRILPTRASDRPKTRSGGLDSISLDRDDIDLRDVEQIADRGQTEAIAWAVRGITVNLADGEASLRDLADEINQRIDEHGLDALTKFGARRYPAFLVRPRAIDIMAAVNRYRKLRVAR